MTNIFKELKNNDYITEKQFRKATSLFLAEKIQEGYFLAGKNITGSDYEGMYVLQNDKNEEFGLGIKVVAEDYLYDLFDVTVQWGKLKNYGLFEFEDEEKATVENFKAVGNYSNSKKVYCNEDKFEEIINKRKQRAKNKYYDNNKTFVAKKLDIKGLKREKDIKVVKVVNWKDENMVYQIYKNDKIYKEVKF